MMTPTTHPSIMTALMPAMNVHPTDDHVHPATEYDDNDYGGDNNDNDDESDNDVDNNDNNDDDKVDDVADNNPEPEDEDQTGNLNADFNDTSHIQANKVQSEIDSMYGERTTTYNLQPRRPRDYGHLHATLEGRMLSQHSMKKGIKLFGKAGVDAVLSDLSRVHNQGVLAPKDAKDLSRAEKKAALEYLMFLKKKCCGKIKGGGYTDSRKQREYTSKEDASSPTVSIEALMLSCVIDANEEQDVATVNIPGAFMQANMDKLVHMQLEGTMAELLVKLDPALYCKCVQVVNGKPVLYMGLKKALYRTMLAALLFWRLLTSKLVETGFKVNPYDWCVANKDIDGK
jgi:hypothetical protein